jgi:hypothetical protein
MAKFSIFQFQLNKEDEMLINSQGWDASPKIKSYISSKMGKGYDPKATLYYDIVAKIEADNLDQVFDIGNIGPEKAIERIKSMHSISVGDVIMEDDTGDLFYVAKFGFTKI